MRKSLREKILRDNFRRYAGLWVCQPEPAVKVIVASGDNEVQAKERARGLGFVEPFSFFCAGS